MVQCFFLKWHLLKETAVPVGLTHSVVTGPHAQVNGWGWGTQEEGSIWESMFQFFRLTTDYFISYRRGVDVTCSNSDD